MGLDRWGKKGGIRTDVGEKASAVEPLVERVKQESSHALAVEIRGSSEEPNQKATW